MALLILLLPACSLLTPEQRGAAQAQVQTEYEAGNITAAQRDAAVAALREDPNAFDWTGLGIAGLNVLLALVGGPMIVRKMRGPPTQKVGLPPSMVK
jgi:hypothetical protein